jgi:hypothetical protein
MRKLLTILFWFLILTASCQNNFFWSYGGLNDIIISTDNPSSIGTTTFTGGGDISENGSGVITRGIVVHTSANPTIATFTKKVEEQAGYGSFSYGVIGLSSSTLYYYRAYAINNAGTVYGNEYSFTTGTAVYPPTVVTNSVSSITTTSASTGGNVTATGGASVTARGVCYKIKTSGIPTIADDKTSDGTGTGTFTSSLTSLTSGVTYYYRAYATNSAGTSYGNLYEFSTLSTVVVPTVVTSTPSSITTSSAELGGNVTSDGGSTVTQRGVVYSALGIPYFNSPSDVVVNQNGSGTGVFTESITGLSSSTIYYVRAYAANISGIGYGQMKAFQTSSGNMVPSITTTAATSETVNGATVGGDVTSENGSSVTEVGVLVSTFANFDTYTSYPTTLTLSPYSIVLDDMECTSETYYYRAYAINGVGMGVGDIMTFTTLSLSSLLEVVFWYSIQSDPGGVITYITNETELNTACTNITSEDYTFQGGEALYVDSPDIESIPGSSVFYSGSGCLTHETGYFLLTGSFGGDTYKVHIVDGVLDTMVYCGTD